MSKVEVKMWYDSYEAKFGDGFYPQMKGPGDEVILEFILTKDKTTWHQSTGEGITGLDGNCGDELLAHLNSQANASATKIEARHGRQLFPKY